MYRKRVTNNFTDEQLLEFVRKYESYNNMHVDRADDEPSPRRVVQRFGSWSTATKLAGVEPKSGLRPDRATNVYLVRVNDEYYKLGITQMSSVLARFVAHGVKNVTVIDSILMEDLASARAMESELLSLVQKFQVRPNIEGWSECFEVRESLGELLDLYAPLSKK